MEDIRLAVGLIGFVSVAIFMVVKRLLKGRSTLFLDLMAVIIVVTVITYVYSVWGQLWIVKWIPLPSVIILSNWFPPMLATLGAVVWRRMDEYSIARRLPAMAVITLMAAYSLTYFIPTEAPVCEDKWIRAPGGLFWPVCLQTTKYTCSAASAATLLHSLGIETTEQEMATLCLTRSGTTWLGLYHGLSTKLLGTPYRVEFFECEVSELPEMAAEHPVLLCCRLDSFVAEQVPEYVSTGGWIPGTAHSVIYFRPAHDQHVIGDPSQGYESWSDRDLLFLWTGTGLRITREPAEQVASAE